MYSRRLMHYISYFWKLLELRQWKIDFFSLLLINLTLLFHLCMCADHRSAVLKEITHNLDYCDIMVLGEELKAELESLELQHSALLGKHLEYANSSTGMSIYGKVTHSTTYYCLSQYKVLTFSFLYICFRCRLYFSLHRGDSTVALSEPPGCRLRPHLQNHLFWAQWTLHQWSVYITGENQTENVFASALNHSSELWAKFALYHSFSEVNILHSEEAVEHVNHDMAPPKYMQIIHPTVIESNNYYSFGECL